MEITVQQYISNEKDSQSYVTTYVNLFESRKEKSGKEGDIYVILKMSSIKKLPFQRLSKFVLDSLVDGYLYSHEKTTNESMKSALADGFNKLRNLVQSDKDVEGNKIDLTILICLVKKEGLYIGSIGKGEIYVIKDGKAVNIAEIMEKKEANTAGVLLEENEALLLSTQGILSENLADIVVASEQKKIAREITKIGVNLKGDNALISFVNQKKKEAPSLIVETLKPETEEETKPTSQEESVEKQVDEVAVKEKKRFGIKDIKIGKLKVNDNVKKIGKTFTQAGSQASEFSKKIKPSPETVGKFKNFFYKVGIILKKIWESIRMLFVKLWQKISLALARKRWFKKVMSKYSEISFKQPRRTAQTVGVRIDDYKVKDLRGKRIKIVLGILLIIVLIIFGVNFSIKTKQANELSKDANQKFDQIDTFLDKTEQNIVSDKSSAEVAYFEAGNLLKEIPSPLREKDIEREKKVNERFNSLGDQLFKKEGFSSDLKNLSVYINPSLSSMGEGVDLVDIDKYMDKNNREYLLLTDKGKKVVYKILIEETPTVEVIPDEKKLIKIPQYVSVGERGIFVYDKDAGVLKSPIAEDGTLGSFISLPGILGRDIPDDVIEDMIILTANDNVYLVSSTQKAVLRSTAVYGDRYSMLNKYIENPLFEKAKDIHGDFSTYLFVQSDEGILRYIWSAVEQRQVPSELGITGLSGGLGKITKGYTYADSMDSGLYMFDSEGRRFLRFEKPQESVADLRHPNQLLLLKQYEYRGGNEEEFKNVKDFVVDYKEENIYVLDGNTVWKIAL